MSVNPKFMGSFEKDTLHRLCVQAARYWVIEHKLRLGELPENVTFFAYPNGPGGFDWGNPPGPDDPTLRPMRGKRVRITMTIEQC